MTPYTAKPLSLAALALGLLLALPAQAQNWHELSAEQQRQMAVHAQHWDQFPPERQARLLQRAEAGHLPNNPERQRARAERLANMTPEQRAARAERIERWQALPPEQREQLRHRLKSLTPEQRAQLKARREAFQQLPEAERQALRQRMGKLRELPPDARQKARQCLKTTGVENASSCLPP